MEKRQVLARFRLATDFLAIGDVDSARTTFESISTSSRKDSALKSLLARQAEASIRLLGNEPDSAPSVGISVSVADFACRLSARDSRRFVFRGFFKGSSEHKLLLAREDHIRKKLLHDKTVQVSFRRQQGLAGENEPESDMSTVRNVEVELNLERRFGGIAWEELPASNPGHHASIRVSPFYQLSGEILWLAHDGPSLQDLEQIVTRMLRRLGAPVAD